MNNLSPPSVILNDFFTRSILLSLITVFILTLIIPEDVFASRTRGGSRTYYHHHDFQTLCTAENFEGTWTVKKDHPVSVSHSMNDELNSDVLECSGWLSSYEVPEGEIVDHSQADFGSGFFLYTITYTSDVSETCTDSGDANSGIGQECSPFDDDNKAKKGGSSTPSAGATAVCQNNADIIDNGLDSGTTYTIKFQCAEGMEMFGSLTLLSTIDGLPQEAPDFTNCSEARVASGECKLDYSGPPMKTVKVKGQTMTVVDQKACLTAFPLANVYNSLGSLQLQPLEEGEVLFYKEVSNTGTCDANSLPEDEGSPVAAYGRHCHSDLGVVSDPKDPDGFFGDEGFNGQMIACASNRDPHTVDQDVETVELADLIVESQPNLNLNCTTGGNTDSGGFKVTITKQAKILASDVLLDPAPTLEGVSPTKAVISTDEFGVDTLVLTYPTCEDLSANVIANNNLTGDDNNTNVVLELLGQTDTDDETLSQSIRALIEIKVNGL